MKICVAVLLCVACTSTCGFAIDPLYLERVKSTGQCKECNFEKADLTGVDFREVNLDGSNFTGADLKGAVFSFAELKGADFRGANLEGAVFKGASMNGASIKGANLKGSDFSGADLRDFGTTSALSPDDTYITSCDDLRKVGAIIDSATQCR